MSASSSADLPTEVAFELTGHQGAVRAVRFNSEKFKYLKSFPLNLIFLPMYAHRNWELLSDLWQ